MKIDPLLQHRQNAVIVRLVDRRGQPLSDTTIRVDQKSHQFLFGCGAFDVLSAVAPEKGMPEEFIQMEKDRTEKWLDLYNYGTLPFYWGRYEPTEGDVKAESRRAAAAFLKEHGVRAKGHPLCWHTVCADWLLQYDNKTLLQKQLDRIHREASGFKGLIDMWDVINEVCIMPNFDKYDNAVTRLCQEYGRIRLVKMVFEAAKEANPDAVLVINDFNTTSAYECLIDGLLNAGVPISVIGIQSHQHQGYWGKEKLLDVLERFSRFGLPIHFTENTLVSGSLIPPEIDDLNDWQVEDWPSTPEFEERQKNEMEEMYTILFEHPLVEAITGWDFADGAWLGAPSGVVHRDGSLKPAYTMLQRHIHGDWETHTSVTTDENGFARIEGFKGSYELTVEREGSAPCILPLVLGDAAPTGPRPLMVL
ncbi:Endo-1,4-beta-xylanase, GH35 family [Lachnospiraceae bacterium NK3A20]|nr:Endo-1,4-beta-xylanase, GH35 family [Lachnospiraceae bacterium NK3A20]